MEGNTFEIGGKQGPYEGRVPVKRVADRFGFSEEAWSAAKEEVKKTLIGVARKRGATITYSELASALRSAGLELDARDPRLFALLDDANLDEAKAKRPMLSSLVVRQGEKRPGSGFYKIAKSLGHDTHDEEKFWIDECTKIYDYPYPGAGPTK